MFNSNPLLAAVNKVTGTIAGVKSSSPPPAAATVEDDSDKKDDDDDDDDDDLSGALRDMDIDRDFNALRSSTTSSTTDRRRNGDHHHRDKSHERDHHNHHRDKSHERDHHHRDKSHERDHHHHRDASHERHERDHHHRDASHERHERDHHSKDRHVSKGEKSSNNSDDEGGVVQDLSIWKRRWHGRDEIFSSNYHPSTVEEQDVQQLADSLGIHARANPLASVQNLVVSALSPVSALAAVAPKPTSTTTTLSTLPSTEQVTRLLLVDGHSTPPPTTNHSPTADQQPMGRSILLQRGTVMVSSHNAPSCQRELVILTHGFLVVHATTESEISGSGCCTEMTTPPPGGWLSSMPKLPPWNGDATSSTTTTSTTTNVEAAHLWHHVTLVSLGEKRNTFIIHVQDDVQYTFTSCNAAQQEAWLNVLETSVLHAYHRFVVPTKVTKPQDNDDDEDDDDDDDEDETWSLGWQHRIIQRSFHAPAVTGDAQVAQDMVERAPQSSSPPRRYGSSAKPSSHHVRQDVVDQLDHYQAWSALHYAAYHNRVAVARILLKAGADPNVVEGTPSSCGKDKRNSGSGRTPLYLAERYRFAEMKKLLESHGARASAMARNEERGALFGSVAAVEDKKKYQKEQQAAFAAAQQQHAMQALRERGQRIEQLDDKTQELQQNAQDYRDLAKTLKDQTMQKKWYQM